MKLLKTLKTLIKFYALSDTFDRSNAVTQKEIKAELETSEKRATEAVTGLIADATKVPIKTGDKSDVRSIIAFEVEKMEKHLKDNALDMDQVTNAVNSVRDGVATADDVEALRVSINSLAKSVEDIKKAQAALSDTIDNTIAEAMEELTAPDQPKTEPQKKADKKKNKPAGDLI